MKNSSDMITAIDIGSSKICCVVAEVKEKRSPYIRGYSHHQSNGIRNGIIIDMDKVEDSIHQTIQTAEKMANVTIENVIVNISNASLYSKTINTEIPLNNRQISDHEVHRILKQSQGYSAGPEKLAVHTLPINFTVDQETGIRDPRGMFGRKLGIQTHIISSNTSPIKNLDQCLTNCHLIATDHVVSGYASGLSCLVEDEQELGVTLIDMGAGTTTISVFSEKNIVYVSCIPVGSYHVTNDIARGLSTPLNYAERMKTLYGSAIASPNDDQEIIDVPQIGEEDQSSHNQVPKSILVGIIQPRLEETFELIRDELETSGMSKISGRRVVLTGGGASLNGVRDLASLILDKQVRIGTPCNLPGLPKAISSPTFSTVTGLLNYATKPKTFMSFNLDKIRNEPKTIFEKINSFFRKGIV